MFNKFKIATTSILLCLVVSATFLFARSTVIDDFDTADSNVLGHQLSPWTKNDNNTNNNANQARFQDTSTGTFARAGSAVSTDNNYAQGVLVNTPAGNDAAILTRWDATSWMDATGPTSAYAVVGLISGTCSMFGYYSGSAHAITSGACTIAAGDTIYFSAVGSTLTFKVNGATVLTASDGNITTGKFGGFYGYKFAATDQRWDSYEAGDIGTTVQNSGTKLLLGVGR